MNTEPRDTIFGDQSLAYWTTADCNEIPWSLFKEAKENIEVENMDAAIVTLKSIVSTPALESRHYLQAHYFLSELGEAPSGEIKIYGVVVEISMPEGVDLLAVYADHSARYYNYSGSVVIWEHPDNSLDELIDTIMKQATDIVACIGPWKGKRPAAPGNDMARISMLTSHGLHFGEAKQSVLFNDALAGKTLYAMAEVMQALVNKSSN